MKNLKIAFGSITQISNRLANYGNQIIEYSLRKYIPKPNFEFSLIDPISDKLVDILKSFDLIINPGSTHLTPQETQSVNQLIKLGKKVVVIGGCIWNKYPVSLSLANSVFQPIGVRDPFTYELLGKAKIPSILIGCPVLLLDLSDIKKIPGKLVFSFSRTNIPEQISLLTKFSTKYAVTVVFHEECEKSYPLPGSILRINGYPAEQALFEYSTASIVVTGRVHGALPAVASKVPVVYFEVRPDSRASLLKYIGINPVALNSVDPEKGCFCKQQIVQELQKSFLNYLQMVFNAN